MEVRVGGVEVTAELTRRGEVLGLCHGGECKKVQDEGQGEKGTRDEAWEVEERFGAYDNSELTPQRRGLRGGNDKEEAREGVGRGRARRRRWDEVEEAWRALFRISDEGLNNL